MKKDIIIKYLRDRGEIFDFIIEADLNNLTSTKYALLNNNSNIFKLVDIESTKKEITSVDSKGKKEKKTNHEITDYTVLKTFDISSVISVTVDKFAMSKLYKFDNGDFIRIHQNSKVFDEYLLSHNIKFNETQRAWYKKIIGFRSGTIWKMILSTIIILTLLLVIFSLLPDSITDTLIPLLGMLSISGLFFYGFKYIKNFRNKDKRSSTPIFMSLALLLFAASLTDAESTTTLDKENESEASKLSTVAPQKVKTNETASTEEVTTENSTAEKQTTEKPTSEQITTEEPENKPNDKDKIGTTTRFIAYFSRHIDGDTSVLNIDGEEKKVRYLLIDTPETKHPRTGVQPFGPEASARTEQLLANAKNIEVEYDIGEKSDKYGRDLVYVYADGAMINETLVREGLASVSYVYPPNTRYLDQLKNAESKAKAEKIGIWSLDSAFEENTITDKNTESNSNNLTEEIPQNNQTQNFVQDSSTNTVESFGNCTDLRQVYPSGVPSTHPAYNSKMDRDGDGYACEAS